MTKKQIYKVAEHLFSIEMDNGSFIWSRMEEPYGPFETDAAPSGNDGYLFEVSVIEDTPLENEEVQERLSLMKPIYSNYGKVEPGFIELAVYKDDNGLCIEFTQPRSATVNGRVFLNKEYDKATLYLNGTLLEKWNGLNTGLNFCYVLSAACRNTVLTHASCVTYNGKAYLFLGKSGTGKSTHSRMWLNALDGVVLLNDDHPVIRVHDDGNVIAYGSPWSGKTRCYKNIQAPVGGMIRISRAPYNKARRLSNIESYASLMPTFSGISWEKNLADGRDRTIQGIIRSVPCWVMECLPDNDAAKVCCETVTNVL